jgi:arginase
VTRSGAASIADRVQLHDAAELRRDPLQLAAHAAGAVAAQVSGWWLHVDLDVLDGNEFHACGAATDPSMPEGLTWPQLTDITRTILQTDGCRGWSLGVYNADLDPDGHQARRIVAYLGEVTSRRPARPRRSTPPSEPTHRRSRST